ncbi:hypothetical protein GF1_30200 [Desulfolithobacter dissulfuricans]|uniref:Uncharacterized protein n=1 Tax=Desulfolithobacter dissulfuricans TaxID=2795293 RepID=A0A915U3J1_9BACT|nr:hypothetical protein GF1_30200 [Desulfolithobacter dissulfuricans]
MVILPGPVVEVASDQNEGHLLIQGQLNQVGKGAADRAANHGAILFPQGQIAQRTVQVNIGAVEKDKQKIDSRKKGDGKYGALSAGPQELGTVDRNDQPIGTGQESKSPESSRSRFSSRVV